MSFELIRQDGYFGGAVAAPGVPSPPPRTLDECKAACLASVPYGQGGGGTCMGLTWRPPVGPTPSPPAPTPTPTPNPRCTSTAAGDCVMVSEGPDSAGFHAGAYNETQASGVKTLDACKAAW